MKRHSLKNSLFCIKHTAQWRREPDDY
jgi:hypothetical protein